MAVPHLCSLLFDYYYFRGKYESAVKVGLKCNNIPLWKKYNARIKYLYENRDKWIYDEKVALVGYQGILLAEEVGDVDNFVEEHFKLKSGLEKILGEK